MGATHMDVHQKDEQPENIMSLALTITSAKA